MSKWKYKDFDDWAAHGNPFFDNHLFNEADIKRATLGWRDKLRVLFCPMKVMCSDGYAWHYKVRGGAYYFFKREPLFTKATDVQLSGGVRANHTVPSELARGEGSNK